MTEVIDGRLLIMWMISSGQQWKLEARGSNSGGGELSGGGNCWKMSRKSYWEGQPWVGQMMLKSRRGSVKVELLILSICEQTWCETKTDESCERERDWVKIVLFGGEDFWGDFITKLFVLGHQRERFCFPSTTVNIVAMINLFFKVGG